MNQSSRGSIIVRVPQNLVELDGHYDYGGCGCVVRGLGCAVRGVRCVVCAVCGVWGAMCGVRRALFGVRYKLCMAGRVVCDMQSAD